MKPPRRWERLRNDVANYKRRVYKGPVCKVCQRRRADVNQTVCTPCKAVFQTADRVSLSRSAIKRAMLDMGIPVRPQHTDNCGFQAV